MLHIIRRTGSFVVVCLLTAVSTLHAQVLDLRGPSPAADVITSVPDVYSPTVSFGYLPALQVATPIPGSSTVPNDFNHDGTSDLLWFNPLQSQVGYWTMQATAANVPFYGGGVTRTGSKTINITPGYFVGASGDFDNDGYADLVFTSASRDLWLWTNDQRGGFTSTQIDSYPDAWQLVGAGDINGDGYDDLLWLDPSDCQFAYWLMEGGTRIGSRVINVTCGYYPVGLGYYTPTNRLSILWTSAAHDLYFWDSTGDGFASFNASSEVNLTDIWAFGGGYEGNGMGAESYRSGIASGSTYSRVFDARYHQTSFSGVGLWDGGANGAYGSGGYVIAGNGMNLTGLYMIDPVNLRVSTSGLSNTNVYFTGNAPIPPGTDSWPYPAGWYVVGAPINGTAPLPWH